MLSKKMFPPPSNGWIHTKFEKEQIDFLWEILNQPQTVYWTFFRLSENAKKSLLSSYMYIISGYFYRIN